MKAPLRWNHYAISKDRAPVALWHGAIPHKNEHLNYTVEKAQNLATLYRSSDGGNKRTTMTFVHKNLLESIRLRGRGEKKAGRETRWRYELEHSQDHAQYVRRRSLVFMLRILLPDHCVIPSV